MDPNLPDLSSHDRSRVYSRLAKTLADLHSLDPAQLGLEGFGNPMHYCRRQVCVVRGSSTSQSLTRCIM
jgi:aminoglycoside phosphotransferase (APT) family kinase protein